MFVRTKKGRIFDCVVGEQMGKPIYYPKTSETNGYIDWNEVYNKSENIIDILEVGDYVNGIEVLGLIDSQIQKLLLTDNGCISNGDIKSIVTKEQFSQIEYKVNND